MKNKNLKNVVFLMMTMLLTFCNTSLLAQSEIIIKKNDNGEPQISIENTFRNTFIGVKSGDENLPSAIFGQDNVFIGWESGKSNTQGSGNTFLGSAAGSTINGGIQNTFLGAFSGQYNTGSTNTFLGNQSGIFNTSGSGNVFLGYKAGQNENGSNKLIIENSEANLTGALIYGEFDNNYLRLNANVNINGAYTLPSTGGLASQVLTLNNSNQATWSTMTTLIDSDNDTRIDVEDNADEDEIYFTIEGQEGMTMGLNASEMLWMNVPNVSFGKDAGKNTTLENNVFIGNSAGKIINEGSDNTFIGDETGTTLIDESNNTLVGAKAGKTASGEGNTYIGGSAGIQATGTGNTMLGLSSGYNIDGDNNVTIGNGAGSDASGDGNIFLGANAGNGATGGNKLFIENSNAGSTAALIYGEFDNNLLRLNAEVNINGAYTLPTNSGMDAQVLTFNNSGHSEWSYLSNLSDNDNDTGIYVEETPDEDAVRVKVEDEDLLVVRKNASGLPMVEPQSAWYGLNAGLNSSSSFSVLVGNSAGMNSSGTNNTMVGHNAGQNVTTGSSNTFVGVHAGKMNTNDENSYIGAFTGEEASGRSNTYVGYSSGKTLSGDDNTLLGTESGTGANGDANIFLGKNAGNLVQGDGNVVLGLNAGYSIDGSSNLVLGTSAGYLSGGNANVFIGPDAGSGSHSSDKLYIENTGVDSTEALIYGEFDNNRLRVNGDLGISTNAEYPIHINDIDPTIKQANSSNQGAVYYASNNIWQVRFSDENELVNSGLYMTNTRFEPYNDDDLTLGSAGFKWKEVFAVNATINTSDIRFKKNINALSYGLEEVMQMRPVSYQWKSENNGRIINGFIAQEMESIVPEVVHVSEVHTDSNKMNTESEYDELYGMRYTELIPVLTKAIQEQQVLIEDQKSLIEALNERVEQLEKK